MTFILMVTIWMSAWSVPSIQSTTRYQERKVLLAIVVNRTFTSEGVNLCACLFIVYRRISCCSCVKFSQLVSTAKLFLTVDFSQCTVLICNIIQLRSIISYGAALLLDVYLTLLINTVKRHRLTLYRYTIYDSPVQISSLRILITTKFKPSYRRAFIMLGAQHRLYMQNIYVYEMCTSPSLSRSSAIWHLEHSNEIKICNIQKIQPSVPALDSQLLLVNIIQGCNHPTNQ